MKYRPRPGIVLTKVCGMNVLIPTRMAYGDCHTIRQLPMLWAATWDLISRGTAEETIIRVHQIFTKNTDMEIRRKVEDFCKKLCEEGFMIYEPDDETDL